MESEHGVALRQVKLKVLYTFDHEHKNNHLARWPHMIEVQSAQLDENNIVGCIDLKTCLEAVTSASPELTSNAENDYTIYAYDYSEPDTPLVGQGMLSRAMAQESDAETESEAMITGRITKNVMGLFSKNAQETLEVKLRLTPMANSGFRRRSGSMSSNPDAVQSHWNSLSLSNGAFRSASPVERPGLEAMQRMLSEGAVPRDRSAVNQFDTFQNQNLYSSRPGSRAGTPIQSQQINHPSRQSGPQSRPASRTQMRASSHARRDSFNSGYYSGEEVTEEGPAKKRARVERVCHPSRSNLNIERQPDSLRVAASTASSVRLHRPVPLNPITAALQHNGLAEEPVRPPTPMPAHTRTGRPRGRPRKVISANLLRGPKPRNSSPGVETQQQQADVYISSPEDIRADSTASTPGDLPSSPPMMADTHNLVTSPQLPPPLVNETDSGFMSGSLVDLFGEEAALLDFNEFLHDKPLEAGHVQNESQHQTDPQFLSIGEENTISRLSPVFDENIDIENAVIEMEPPPPPPPPPPPARAKAPVLSKANSFTSNHRQIVPAPRLAPALAPKFASGPEDGRFSEGLPRVPASDPVGRTFHRSHTWAPDMSDAIMSDIGTSDEQAKGRPRKRVGKEQTKARLENAIASGEMPPFCDNCGAIETPAWRRAYSKVFDCPWDDVETSLEPGECCYKKPLEYDDNKNIIKFIGYKSERRPDEKLPDGWTQICLCNPCGLWFHKSKTPRPPEKWQKKDPNNRKKKRTCKSKKVNTSKPTLRSDAVSPASDDSSPADTAAEGGDTEDVDDSTVLNGDEAHDDDEPELPPLTCQLRAGSAGPLSAQGLKRRAVEHMQPIERRVQSSPIRAGRDRFDVIEIDLTPKSVQRQLFPSPQSLKNKYHANFSTSRTDHTQIPGFVRRSPRLNKVRDAFAVPFGTVALVAMGDEENLAPTASLETMNNLQGGDIDEIMPPPSTPQRRSERLLFKTPNKTPSRDFGDLISPNVQRTPSARHLQSTTSRLVKEFDMASVAVDMTPFSRSIYDTLHGDETISLNHLDTPQKGNSGRVKTASKRVSVKDIDSLFDFPDLPSLKGSSPIGVDLMQAFAFSQMATDPLHPDFNDLFSTDLPIPSSPPQSYFDFVNSKNDQTEISWPAPAAQDISDSEHLATNDGMLCVTSNGEKGLRRSPRKHAA